MSKNVSGEKRIPVTFGYQNSHEKKWRLMRFKGIGNDTGKHPFFNSSNGELLFYRKSSEKDEEDVKKALRKPMDPAVPEKVIEYRDRKEVDRAKKERSRNMPWILEERGYCEHEGQSDRAVATGFVLLVVHDDRAHIVPIDDCVDFEIKPELFNGPNDHSMDGTHGSRLALPFGASGPGGSSSVSSSSSAALSSSSGIGSGGIGVGGVGSGSGSGSRKRESFTSMLRKSVYGDELLAGSSERKSGSTASSSSSSGKSVRRRFGGGSGRSEDVDFNDARSDDEDDFNEDREGAEEAMPFLSDSSEDEEEDGAAAGAAAGAGDDDRIDDDDDDDEDSEDGSRNKNVLDAVDDTDDTTIDDYGFELLSEDIIPDSVKRYRAQ